MATGQEQVGGVISGWLLYILSESDHRLSRVEDWSASHLGVLRAVLDCPSLRSLDFADDRLGRLLDRYLDRLPENLADLDYVQINRDKAVDQPQKEGMVI